MRRRGFSLLEVVVALAILAVSLVAIFHANATAVYSHTFTKKLTVASLLARSKLTDLEQDLYDKGFSNDDDEESGDFSDEGWPSFKWRAKIVAPKTQGLTPQQMIGAILNLPLGDGKDGAGGADALGPLAAMFGMGGAQDKGGGPQPSPAAGLAALGPFAAQAQGQFTQMVEQLAKSVREVHLTVSWKEGKNTESIDLVTHVVSLGPGSDRNGTATPAGAAAGAGGTNPAAMVNARTGAPVPNPLAQPDGTFVDPASPQDKAIPLEQYMASQAGGGIPKSMPNVPNLPGAFGGRPGSQFLAPNLGNVLNPISRPPPRGGPIHE